MKSFVKKWKSLLMIPFLCAALVLSTGCGGKSSGSVEQTELPVVEESVEEQETQENQSSDNTDDQPDEEEADASSGDENGWGEDVDTTDGETYGDDTYSDENEDENQQEWNASDDSEEYSGDDSYSVADDNEGGDADPEDSGYSEEENRSGSGSENRDYGEEYQGSGGEISENGVYTTKEDVSLYLHTYGRLPNNFMTKKEAQKLGWTKGSLEKYAPGMCIGGDRFGNYEKILPKGSYHECDINTLGKDSRGAERLVFSEDGRIYYTADHYRSFTLLYEK